MVPFMLIEQCRITIKSNINKIPIKNSPLLLVMHQRTINPEHPREMRVAVEIRLIVILATVQSFAWKDQ